MTPEEMKKAGEIADRLAKEIPGLRTRVFTGSQDFPSGETVVECVYSCPEIERLSVVQVIYEDVTVHNYVKHLKEAFRDHIRAMGHEPKF